MNIALIYDDIKYQNESAMLFDDAGYTVNWSFSTDAPWFEVVRNDQPDLLVISISYPEKKLLLQLEGFKKQLICPVIVIAHEADDSIIEQVIFAGADSCITSGVTVDRVKSLVQINLARFKVSSERLRQIDELTKNVEFLESRLNDRKDIERAKGLLMQSYRMNENDAYNAMRRMAMDTGNKLGEVARNLISMSEVLS